MATNVQTPTEPPAEPAAPPTAYEHHQMLLKNGRRYMAASFAATHKRAIEATRPKPSK